MEDPINGDVPLKICQDLNGNTKKTTKKRNGKASVKDTVTTNDGRIFYPCQYCNKVFPIKKTRTWHIKKCPAKDYILSVGDQCEVPPESPQKPAKTSKIDIQQNIVLSKSLPIKLTIRRSPSNGTEVSNHFTVSTSLILKEKNESNEDFNSLSKRLQSNCVTITKQPAKDPSESDEKDSVNCPKCMTVFSSSNDLLRHERECTKYPKILMAMSEIKKFYKTEDRSECPICHKPLKMSFRSAFIKHLHTHTNEMRYACKVCNRKFGRADHMRAHEKRHVIEDAE